MKERPYYNPGPNTVYKGGRAIPAGTIGMVAGPTKAPRKPEAPTPAPDPDQVTADELAAASVAEVREAVAARTVEGIPVVSDTALALLTEAEQASDKPRKGVLQAIDEEQMRRAADRAGDDSTGD